MIFVKQQAVKLTMPKLSRRQNVPQFHEYKKYKKYLREDFQYQCVYCSIHENEYGGPRSFTADHFRPQSLFQHLKNDYQNLLYCCNVCNPFKSNDWPSDDPLTDGIGYLDPCEHNYDDHFQLSSFEIEGLTPVAAYMIERLHLNRPQLTKLRKMRFNKERTHLEIVQTLKYFLKIIEAAIDSGKLPQGSKNLAINQLNDEIEKWERQWEPIYELEDYREQGR